MVYDSEFIKVDGDNEFDITMRLSGCLNDLVKCLTNSDLTRVLMLLPGRPVAKVIQAEINSRKNAKVLAGA